MQKLFLQWLDERTGLPGLFEKIRNRTVPDGPRAFRFLPTMILFAFLLQVVTGVFLWIFYTPAAQSAWESLFYIQFFLPGGWMVRGIHHFSAALLTVLLGFQFLTLVFSGRYRSPREFSFWAVLLLLLCSLGSSLTGDLLGWSLSGVSATLVRVRFLQMLPVIGEPLFRIAAGGPEFGTLTLPRFLVLHILVFGGGFFALAVLWRFFEARSNVMLAAETVETPIFSFRSGEILRCSLACLLVMAAVLLLVYRNPVLHMIRPDLFSVNELLPEASLGVHPGVPADPSDFYDAARPEWSFRALYHLSNLKRSDGTDVFPGEKKFIPVFVITGILITYLFLMPVLGRAKIGHYFNLTAMALLLAAFGYLTVASYRHDYFDPEMSGFREDRAKAEKLADRAVELCLSPDGIPPTGARTLLARDPLLRGPALYERHCAVCHPFTPLAGEREHPDFKPIPCETVKAPNLYDPVRRHWIEGFFVAKRLQSDDYFGKTKFANGMMYNFVLGEMRDIIREDVKENERILDELVTFLYEEAKRDGPRIATPQGVDGLTDEHLNLFATFDCARCHTTYDASSKPAVQAPDLRGYMSRDWMIGIVADPETVRFYGPPIGRDRGNDAMPAFHRSGEEPVLTMDEIGILTDWLRGNWFRLEKRKPPDNPAPKKTEDAAPSGLQPEV